MLKVAVKSCVGGLGLGMFLVIISQTALAETAGKTGDHSSTATESSEKTTSRPTGKTGGETKSDTQDSRQAALDRMKAQLRKLDGNGLKKFAGDVAQIQKLSPEVLSQLVDNIPNLDTDLARRLKETFEDEFPRLGDTADADLNRLVAQLLLGLEGEQGKGDGQKLAGDPNQGRGQGEEKSEQEKLEEAIQKALAEREKALQDELDKSKAALDELANNFKKGLDDVLNANELAKNNEDALGDALNDALGNLGETPLESSTPSDSGSGGGGGSPSDSGGGSGSGSPTGNDSGLKADKGKNDSGSGLNFPSPKESKPATASNDNKGDEAFSLDGDKKDAITEKPDTVKTGASEPSTPQENSFGDNGLINPSAFAGQPPGLPGLAGNAATPGPAAQVSSLAPPFEGGGGGAGIQITPGSASPLSGGEGDPFSGLGNVASTGYDDRGRYFYLRTGDKDWISGGGASGGGDGYEGASEGGGDYGDYGRRPASSVAASLGIGTSSGDREPGGGRGIFSERPLAKLCNGPSAASIGVCAPRPRSLRVRAGGDPRMSAR